MNLKLKGYLLAIVAAATYGMNPLFALPLYSDGMNPDSVLFFRYLLAIPILALMLRFRGRSLALHKKEVFPLAVLGLLMSLSSLTLFLSYNYMAAGIASTILFVYPIMVAVLMALVYKERISLMTVICLVTALAGIGLLYKGGDGVTLSPIGTVLSISAALFYAVYIAGVNSSSLKLIPTLKVTLYVLVFGLFLFLVRILFFTSLTLPSTWYLWANLLALAIFPTAISFLCTTSAIQYIGATPTAILGALEPLTAIVFGVSIFHEILTPRDCVGLVLIITAVTLVVAGSSVSQHLVRFRKLFPRLPFHYRALK